jgi:hypothetical protein
MRRMSLATLVTACLVAALPTAASADQFHDQGPNPNPAIFEMDASPYGVDIATWAERSTQWIWGTPLDQSPLFDPTGANCAVNQQGPVWYIARIAGPPVMVGNRECTIPHQKSILLYIGAVVDSWPCPAIPGWDPAPGQSLYDFLAADAKFFMDTVDSLSVSLDSTPMQDVFSYRYVSDDLYLLTGDPSLTEVLDPCITGEPLQTLQDGYFMMFKPLDPGKHTIVVHGTNTFGHDKTFIYDLTIV